MIATAPIQLLDTHTINKIAAGEVVERPASVVKELVENSIDAGASSITVEIKNGGIDFIRITDNGKGIKKEEVEVAFLRHATSKIHLAEDLETVSTLGFRGEALASVAAVAHVELITKTPTDITGKRVVIEAGQIKESMEVACPDGSTFIVRHLFYNVPARKAFLKSSGAEGAKIGEYMYKLALAHPEISFKYLQNNKLVFQTSGNQDLSNCIFSLYGRETAKSMLPIHYVKGDLRITGLVGKPSLSRGNRNYEHFFINGRTIKSFLLQKAVEEGYKGLITIGKFPFVVLHLHLNPDTVDVNVHPTKLEVRLKDGDFIYEAVTEAIKAHLLEESLIPAITTTKTEKLAPAFSKDTQLYVDTFFAPRKENNELVPEKMVPIAPKESTAVQLVQPRTSLFKPSNVVKSQGASVEVTLKEPAYVGARESETIDIVAESPVPKEHRDYVIIGQVFQTYWLIEYEKKLVVVDQHAAHERLNYEKFMRDFQKGTIATQLLLVPETLTITPLEKVWLEENFELIHSLGILFEFFGEDALLIREVPYLFQQPLSIEAVRNMLDTLVNQKVSHMYQLKEERIIQLACKHSVRAKDKLTEQECKKLIEALLALENPFTCPHGRPTIISFTQHELEKLFKRV